MMDDQNNNSKLKPSKRAALSEKLMEKQLGELAQTLFDIPAQKIETALKDQSAEKEKLGQILVEKGLLSQEQLMACTAIMMRKEETFLSHAFFKPLFKNPYFRRFQILLEAFFHCILSFLVVGFLKLEQGGLISIFFIAIGLNFRFNIIFHESYRRKQAFDLLALFTGVFLGFCFIASNFDSMVLREIFSSVYEINGLKQGDTLGSRFFSDINGILFQNFMVLFSVCIITFIYRSFGVLLTLTWNACIWGLTLTILIDQTLLVKGLNPVIYFFVFSLAILPHLILETLGYIYGAITTIYFSRNLLFYGFSKQLLKETFSRSGGLMISVVVIILAALFEVYWLGFILN